jgi:ATP-dependent DNA helicase RecG
MISESIKKQIRDGESAIVEFIADPSDMKRVARTVCAFLNGKGGTVFCGLDEKGNLSALGDANEMVQLLREHLQNKITPHAPLLSVTPDEEDGRRLISVEVPAGTEGPYVYEGAVYVRRGSDTRPVDAATLHRMLQSAAVTTEIWEKRISTGFEPNDLDYDEITETVRETEQSGRFTFTNPADPIAVLRELGLVRSGQFTQGADVLFAKNPALRHPQIRMRATCFAEEKGSDEFIDDKIFEGPLAKILERGEKFIKRNMRTSVSFRSTGLQTLDRAEYPSEAIREGLVNALAHRDYNAFHGGVAVRLYATRLEIWNSGHLPNPLKPGDLKKNHPSIPVNPDIVQVLYIRGYMNRIGRGTQKIVNVCRENGLRLPTWKDDATGVTLTLYARTKLAGQRGPFNKRQTALLAALSAGEEIKPIDYRERFAKGKTERQARRDLKELEDANLLERIGAGAATRYRRTSREWTEQKRT